MPLLHTSKSYFKKNSEKTVEIKTITLENVANLFLLHFLGKKIWKVGKSKQGINGNIIMEGNGFPGDSPGVKSANNLIQASVSN